MAVTCPTASLALARFSTVSAEKCERDPHTLLCVLFLSICHSSLLLTFSLSYLHMLNRYFRSLLLDVPDMFGHVLMLTDLLVPHQILPRFISVFPFLTFFLHPDSFPLWHTIYGLLLYVLLLFLTLPTSLLCSTLLSSSWLSHFHFFFLELLSASSFSSRLLIYGPCLPRPGLLPPQTFLRDSSPLLLPLLSRALTSALFCILLPVAWL